MLPVLDVDINVKGEFAPLLN